MLALLQRSVVDTAGNIARRLGFPVAHVLVLIADLERGRYLERA